MATKEDIVRMIHDEALAQGVPPELAVNVAAKESGFKAGARSPVGALGVMQLMPETARMMGVKNPLDAAQNIRGGIAYLKQQLDDFGGDPALALAAYNAGPGNVRKHGGVPPFPETQNYVQGVLGNVEAFRQAAASADPTDPAQLQVAVPKTGWADKFLQATTALSGLGGAAANVIGAVKGNPGAGNQLSALAQAQMEQQAKAQKDATDRQQVNSFLTNPNVPLSARQAAGYNAQGVPQYAASEAIYPAASKYGQELDNYKAKQDILREAQRGLAEYKQALESKDPVKVSDMAMKLRKEYGAIPAVKDFRTVEAATAKINGVWEDYQKNKGDAKSKAFVDQALIIGFNKILDPQSVVRESEYARTPEGLSLINRIQGSYERLQKGGGGLTDVDRAELVKTMKQLSKGLTGEVDKVNKFYKQEALRSNIAPERIINELEKPVESATSSGSSRTTPSGITYTIEP